MKKSVIISLHVTFWGIMLVSQLAVPYVTGYLSAYDFGKAYMYIRFAIPIYFYLSYFLIFKLIKNKKVSFYTLASLIVITILLFFVKRPLFAYFMILVQLSLLWILVGGLFRFFVDWINKDKIQLQLSKQNLQSELALLKSQINPHFLFNTIHNIDTLISVDPDKASDSLIKLSGIMRYMIYDTDADFIELSKEIDNIRQYIELQKLRQTNSDLVSFKINGKPEEIKIAPMILISFVENAFKHVTNKDVKDGISINLSIVDRKIQFSVENIFDENVKTTKDKTKGIGLANVKRRLELIYPNRHSLEVGKSNQYFKVNLSINTYAS